MPSLKLMKIIVFLDYFDVLIYGLVFSLHRGDERAYIVFFYDNILLFSQCFVTQNFLQRLYS
jgi:hypothetical protein